MNELRKACRASVLAVLATLMVSQPAIAVETVEYIHTDALGSPVAVTDASANVIKRTIYEPYGAVIDRPLKDGPGYAGHVLDASTGLSYMQQRYMDPEIAAFLSVDPVSAANGGGDQFNRYRYANGSPYRFTDPDGRQSWDEFQTGFENGTLNASRYEHGFPLHANWSEQLGYAAGAGIVRGGQSHGGLRVPAMRMQSPKTPSVVVGPVGKVVKSPDANPQAMVGELPKPPTGPGAVPVAQRDPQRRFSESARESKRAEQGGQCGTNCGTSIDKSNSAGHHIKRHADGGATTSDNHSEVCLDCHARLHSKD